MSLFTPSALTNRNPRCITAKTNTVAHIAYRYLKMKLSAMNVVDQNNQMYVPRLKLYHGSAAYYRPQTVIVAQASIRLRHIGLMDYIGSHAFLRSG